jgi:hypothetical protein
MMERGLLDRTGVSVSKLCAGPHRRDRAAGVAVNPVDSSVGNPALQPAARRR